MKKIIALFLCAAAAMAVMTAASCSLFRPPVQSESGSESASESESRGADPQPADLLKEAQERLDTFRELDFAGRKLTLVCPAASVDVYQPTESGTNLSGARIMRNVNAAGAVGVELSVMFTRGDVARELSLTADSGEKYADLVSVPQNRIAALARGGYLQDLVELPYAAVRSGCFDYTAGASGAVYGVRGDFNFDPSLLTCLYYNDALLKAKGVDVGSLCADGRLSVEDFLKTLRELDGSLDAGAGEYGFAWSSSELGSENRITDLVYAAFGLKYLRAGDDPFADVVSETAGNAVSAAREMISLRKLSVTGLIYDGDAFTAGKLCFYADSLDYSLKLPSDLEWGVLPIPSSGDTVTLLPATAEMLCVTAGAPTEPCGALIGAMAAFSDGYIPSMFLRDVFAVSARSSSALESMKAVAASASLDPAFYTAPLHTYVAAASFGAIRTAVKSGESVSSIISGVKDRAEKELAD